MNPSSTSQPDPSSNIATSPVSPIPTNMSLISSTPHHNHHHHHHHHHQQQQQQPQQHHHHQYNYPLLPTSPPPTSSGDNNPPILPPISAFPQLLPKVVDTNRSSLNRRTSTGSAGSGPWTTSHDHTSDAILAEKRRRNAGASSRFRERRKQREKELQERVVIVEQRVQQLSSALRQYNPKHPLIESANSSNTPQQDLNDRVSQLESLMMRFREEKESDTRKLDALEKENAYLKSLLNPHPVHHAALIATAATAVSPIPHHHLPSSPPPNVIATTTTSSPSLSPSSPPLSSSATSPAVPITVTASTAVVKDRTTTPPPQPPTP